MKVNKKLIVLACGIFLLLGTLVYILINANKHVENAVPEIAEMHFNKKIKYRFEVTNSGNEIIKESLLYVAIPPDQGRQKVTGITLSQPYQISVDEVGNKTAVITINRLLPFETKMLDVSVTLDIVEGALESVLNISNELTEPDKYIESDHVEIIAIANQVKAENEFQTAKNAFVWVKGHLEYAGFIADDRGALYAARNKKADCTEYMYLYGALLRANKIPARMVSGFIVESNKLLDVADYHNWVEVYLEGKWRVVDPQKDKFMEQESSYVVMRVLQHNGVSKEIFNNAQQLVKLRGKAKVVML